MTSPSKDDYLEKNASQNPAIELLCAMSPDRIPDGGYVYISPEECAKQRGGAYNVILKDILRGQLRKINRYSYCGAENEFSAANIERAIDDLDVSLSDGLITASKKSMISFCLVKVIPKLLVRVTKLRTLI